MNGCICECVCKGRIGVVVSDPTQLDMEGQDGAVYTTVEGMWVCGCVWGAGASV